MGSFNRIVQVQVFMVFLGFANNTTQDVSRLELPGEAALTFKTYFAYTNKDSRLSWGASYELMAYLSSYRATRNLSYLAQFITYAEKVLSQRDDNIGFNKKAKTWSTIKWEYTRGVPYATLVGDGMISFPYADFASLVLLRDPDLKGITVNYYGEDKTLESLAWDYYRVAEDALKAHQSEKNSDGSYRALADTASFFWDTNGVPIAYHYELPFNHYLAMGRTLIKLAEVSKSQEYINDAYKMAGRFMSWISDRNGNPYWVYWSRDAHVIEDISHGHIDVDFMRLYFEAGLPGMKWRDVYNLSKTFVSKAYKGGGVVSYDLLGVSIPKNPDYREGVSWMMLGNYNYNLKLIGIHAHRNFLTQPASVYSNGGFGAYVKSLYSEFGGRTSLNSNCTLSSECSTGICSPQNVTQNPETHVFESSKMLCKSWMASGESCMNHFDCASGLCDFSSKSSIVLKVGLQERTSRFGTCRSR